MNDGLKVLLTVLVLVALLAIGPLEKSGERDRIIEHCVSAKVVIIKERVFDCVERKK